MIKLVRTNAGNMDFIELVRQLDEGLKISDGDNHEFFDQYNKIDSIKYVVIAYMYDVPIACGAFKEFQEPAVEIKRMFTTPEGRGRGIATQVLNELELWASELSFTSAVLETGYAQPEAIALYRKSGYRQIPNYGQYAIVESSICFAKNIRAI